MTEEELSKMISEFLPYPAEGQHHALKQFAKLVAAAEREKLKHELLTLEKWKGMALAKDGDGRTVQEIEREAREAEREKVAKWMIQRSYATGHGDTLEDLLQELDWQVADGWNRALMNGVKTEREACAKVVEQAGIDGYGTLAAALLVRERGAP
jgi:hypothetical protein